MGGPGAALAAVVMTAIATYASAQPAQLASIEFSDIEGWRADAHGKAFSTFSASCRAILDGLPPSRAALPPSEALKAVCARIVNLGPLDDGAARGVFEREFRPFRVGTGVLTGYYEPEIEGSRTATALFDTPLLARPDDLVTLAERETVAGVPAGLQAAQKTAEGFGPYPERAAIDDGALGERARPLVFAERVDAFFVHIQGSTRVRLPDGTALRLAYDGRNGQKFTGIGRLLVERGALTKTGASMASIRAWLGENPAEARALMRRNASYIFFRIDDALKPDEGPRGAQNVPLAAGRSIAVDRTLWSYGLPFWLDGAFADGREIKKLVVAQDTGSAILGAARGDYFAGSGDAAGAIAGGMKQQTGFIVLLPREAGDSGGRP